MAYETTVYPYRLYSDEIQLDLTSRYYPECRLIGIWIEWTARVTLPANSACKAVLYSCTQPEKT